MNRRCAGECEDPPVRLRPAAVWATLLQLETVERVALWPSSRKRTSCSPMPRCARSSSESLRVRLTLRACPLFGVVTFPCHRERWTVSLLNRRSMSLHRSPRISLAEGASVALEVNVGTQVHRASGTQFTAAPIVTAPAAATVTWQASSANTITWTGGAPTAGANYFVQMSTYNLSGFHQVSPATPQSGEIATTSTSATVPAGTQPRVRTTLLLWASSPRAILSDSGGIAIPGAAAGSGLWLGALAHVVAITADERQRQHITVSVARAWSPSLAPPPHKHRRLSRRAEPPSTEGVPADSTARELLPMPDAQPMASERHTSRADHRLSACLAESGGRADGTAAPSRAASAETSASGLRGRPMPSGTGGRGLRPARGRR